ncbi:uncharacterized protein LOC127863791 [Dreissena polymorpha]|nr:uncharacterized protein LOC127863791 [Dreissena polymorpha]
MELFGILRDLSVGSVNVTVCDEHTLSLVTQSELLMLKEIRLQGIYSTELKYTFPVSLQFLILEKGSCSSDWLYGLLIHLSTLGHSVRLFLLEFLVSNTQSPSEIDSKLPTLRCADLSSVKLEVMKDCPGLYESLPTMNITSLNMTQIDHADMLSQILPRLIHLEQLRICLHNYYMDMRMPKSIKYVFVIFKTLSPSSLRHFVQNMLTTNHTVNCKLLFRVEEKEDEYTKIKEEYCEQELLEVQLFEVVDKRQSVGGGWAARTLSAAADDADDEYDKHLLRREGEYVDTKPWIHYCKIRMNILCSDNSFGAR